VIEAEEARLSSHESLCNGENVTAQCQPVEEVPIEKKMRLRCPIEGNGLVSSKSMVEILGYAPSAAPITSKAGAKRQSSGRNGAGGRGGIRGILEDNNTRDPANKQSRVQRPPIKLRPQE
jgi:hypothetical protein